MTEQPNEETKAEQREVQRLLGRCLLRLQQYEHLLKTMLIDSEIAGPVTDLGSIRAKRESRTAHKTLGALVGDFLGSYLVSGEPADFPDPADKAVEGPATVSFRFRVGLSSDDFAQTGRDLKELVDLRNMLVHHFIGRHDLWSAEGCRRAQGNLMDAYKQVDLLYAHLVDLARSQDIARQRVAEALRSGTHTDLGDGHLAPDHKVN